MAKQLLFIQKLVRLSFPLALMLAFGIGCNLPSALIPGKAAPAYRWKCWNEECDDLFSPYLVHDLTFISDTEAWIVGTQGYIARWDGKKWKQFDSPTTKTLKAISFISADDGWAVGEDEMILHWDGKSWVIHTPPALGLDPKPTYITFSAIAFASPTTGWITGHWESKDSSKGIILYWDGSNWQSNDTESGIVSLASCLCSITVLSPQNAWVVGSAYGNNTELPFAPIFHWTGDRWDNMTNVVEANGSLNIVKALHPDNVWLGGDEVVIYGDKPIQRYFRGYIMHWNGQEWKKVELPTHWDTLSPFTLFNRRPRSSMPLALFVRSSQDVIVGGDGQLHWNGKTWTEISMPIKDTLILDIEMSPSGQIWALTSTGVFLQLNSK